MYLFILLFCYYGNYINQIAISFLKDRFSKKISNSTVELFSKYSSPGSFSRTFSMLFLFKGLVNTLFTNSEPSSNSIKFSFLFEDVREFSKEFTIVWAFLLLRRTGQPNLLKLSITTKTYLYPSLFSGP